MRETRSASLESRQKADAASEGFFFEKPKRSRLSKVGGKKWTSNLSPRGDVSCDFSRNCLSKNAD